MIGNLLSGEECINICKKEEPTYKDKYNVVRKHTKSSSLFMNILQTGLLDLAYMKAVKYFLKEEKI